GHQVPRFFSLLAGPHPRTAAPSRLPRWGPRLADAVVCKRWHLSMRRGPPPTLLLRAFALRNGSRLSCRPARHPSAAAALGAPARHPSAAAALGAPAWPQAPQITLASSLSRFTSSLAASPGEPPIICVCLL